MPSRRVAAIDLGSNTVHYLLVEADGTRGWRVLDHDQRITRLGEGLAASGRLGETPMARTALVVRQYAQRARRDAATDVRVVATSAVREAGNGRDFAASLARATGAAVSVITGDDEARLTTRGVLAGLPGLPTPLVIFDIGGGSTEYILWRDGTVAAATSLRLGVVPLAERYPFPAPVEPERSGALEEEVRGRLRRELPAAIAAGAPATLVGTAGTVTTLAALDLDLPRYDAARVQGHRLTRAAVGAQLARLGALDAPSRGAVPCLEPARADLIIPGMAIVLATFDVLGVDALIASDWGLREGVVTEVLEGRR